MVIGSFSILLLYDVLLIISNKFYIWQYFYEFETYDRICKQIGFKDGIEMVDGKDFVYSSENLSELEKKLAYQYYTLPQPLKMFILKKN